MTMAQTGRLVRYSAPGRINLIGEHTDYNFGFALPIALPERTEVTYRPSDGDSITVRSDRQPTAVRFSLDTAPGEVDGWAAYVAGVVWALRRKGYPVPGGTMSIVSDVETGSGLASSAALECAVLGAILTATNRHVDRLDRARIAQCAENEYVGAPTGLLDQLAVVYGESRRAQFVDFGHLTVSPVTFDPAAHDVALLLINSHATHRHVDGEYAARRASCERAARDLGVCSLRDVQDRELSALDAISAPDDARRARHVVTENRRVLDVVDALADCDFVEVGQLLTASHISMRDDFEITTEHIDLIAGAAVQAGALGARMTGGGFGGCVIALVDTAAEDVVAAAVREAVTRVGYPDPTIVRTHAASGDAAG